MFPALCVSVRKYIQTSKAVFLVNFFSVLFICLLRHSTPQCYQSIIPLSSPSPPHYLHLRITFFNALLCRHRTRNHKLSSPWGGYHKNICFYPKIIPPPTHPSSLPTFSVSNTLFLTVYACCLSLCSSFPAEWGAEAASQPHYDRELRSARKGGSHICGWQSTTGCMKYIYRLIWCQVSVRLYFTLFSMRG